MEHMKECTEEEFKRVHPIAYLKSKLRKAKEERDEIASKAIEKGNE